MATSDAWKDNIISKIIKLFENDDETCTRVMFYLGNEDDSYKNSTTIPPAWRNLKACLQSDNLFGTFAKRLADDTKSAEKNPEFYKTMNIMYEQFISKPNRDGSDDKFDESKLVEMELIQTTGSIGFLRAWSLIPYESQQQMLTFVKQFITNKNVVQSLDDVVGQINQIGAGRVMIALAALSLGYEAIRNIYRWWKSEISGKRCCKNIIDSTCSIGAGVAGGIGGAAVGSLAGPVGTLAGGVIGGIVSSSVANYLIDWLTQLIFSLPKEEALENAYNYFGVNKKSSNHEINTEFRKKCLEHHPDKSGGEREEFLKVQSYMGIIKAARGELY